MLNPITQKKTTLNDVYQYELDEQLKPENYYILDELPIGSVLIYKGQLYNKTENNTFRSISDSHVTFSEIIEYNLSKSGLKSIDIDFSKPISDKELDVYINAISKFISDTEDEVKKSLNDICDTNGGVIKGPKFDYIKDEDGNIVPRVNVKYARPFPILDFIIRDGIPYIVIDRDEVYDISHLITIYNEQMGIYDERIMDDDD